MTTTSPYRLLGQKGYGSVIPEAAFALASLGSGTAGAGITVVVP